MTKFLALLGFLTIAALSPEAVAEPNKTAIQSVITQQLDAIKNNDADAAFSVASPTIQTQFGDAWTFMSMVARGYPQIYRSVGHKFLNIDTSDGRLQQRVLVEGEKGSVIVRYDMIELDGAWRINGCMIEKVDEA